MDGNAVLEDVEPAVLEDVEPGPGGSNENRAPRVETFRWGAFRFTPKGSPNTEGFGWEASCPFHRKNDSTGCKKSLSVAVAGSSDRAIHALKYWCTAALDVDRKIEPAAIKRILLEKLDSSPKKYFSQKFSS